MRNTIYKLEDHNLYALDESGAWILIGNIDNIVMFGSAHIPQDLPWEHVEQEYKAKAHGVFLNHPAAERHRLAKAYVMGAMRHYMHNEHLIASAKIDQEEMRVRMGGSMLDLHERIRKLEDSLKACASNAGDANLIGAIVDDMLNPKELVESQNAKVDSGSEPLP